MINNSPNNKVIKSLIAVIFFLLSMFIVFKTQILSDFNILTSGPTDGAIETMLLKHWENVLSGKSAWNTVGYFFPYNDTLGYNDGYFLYGIIYSLFRFMGSDSFLSSELVNVALKTLGFIGFYTFVRKLFNVSFLYSLTGAVIFTLANNLVTQTLHAQLLSIVISPYLAYTIIRYVDSLFITGDNRKAITFGCLSGLLLACWLLTTYYMAWFFTFFSVIFGLVFLAIFALNRKKTEIVIKFNLLSVLIPALTTLVAIIPFLVVYLPKASETGMHGFDEVLYYTPRVINILNPGSSNFVFGWLSDLYFNIFPPKVDISGEFIVGFPPAILLFSLYILSTVWIKRDPGIENIALRSLSLAILISIILMLRINDHTLWRYVWEFFPGAKGMRVTARYALFLIFPLTLLVTLFLSKYCSGNAFFYILALFLMIEQVNTFKYQQYDRVSQLKFYNSVVTPPAECKSFFVFGQRPPLAPTAKRTLVDNLYPHNIDAMVISEKFALRTINGFSTFNTPGWDFAYEPYDTYLSRVHNYSVNKEILDGLCMYDLYNSEWKSPTEIKW